MSTALKIIVLPNEGFYYTWQRSISYFLEHQLLLILKSQPVRFQIFESGRVSWSVGSVRIVGSAFFNAQFFSFATLHPPPKRKKYSHLSNCSNQLKLLYLRDIFNLTQDLAENPRKWLKIGTWKPRIKNANRIKP